jgi:hypothetical protein
VIRAQRAELTSLRAERSYPVEALRRLEHELDLDEARLPRRPAGR